MNWNEGEHSVWRSRLNRLARRTKGYTKQVEMLVCPLALLCWQQGVTSISTNIENTADAPMLTTPKGLLDNAP